MIRKIIFIVVVVLGGFVAGIVWLLTKDGDV